MGKIILPIKHQVGERRLIREYRLEQEPAIFLLGPIFDAPEWQDEATRILFAMDPRLTIVNPRRSVAGDLQHLVVDEGELNFLRQRAWERHYIDLLSLERQRSSTMFWLPNRETITPGVVYAGTTRVEFGTMIMKANYEPKTRFTVGAQKEFPNLSIMVDDLQAYAPRTVFETLEETCDEAIRLVRKSI